MGYNKEFWTELNKKLKEKEQVNNIAPTANAGTTKDRKWINTGALDDGFQMSDVPKSIGATVVDTQKNAVAGILNGVESVGDSTIIGANELVKGLKKPFDVLYDLGVPNTHKAPSYLNIPEIGSEEADKRLADLVAQDVIDGQKIANTIITKPIEKITKVDVNKYSLSGDKLDSVVESGGQLALQLGAAAAANAIAPGVGSKVGMTIMGMSSFGSEFENAINNNATYGQALVSGLVSAGAEIITEKLGGINFGGKTLVDVIGEKAAQKFSSKLALGLIKAGKFGASTAAEGVEELASGYIQAFGQKFTYMSDKEINELFSNEDKLESFIGGALLGGTFESVNALQTKASGVDYLTGEQANETKVINKLYEDAIKGKDLTSKEKSQIRDKIVKQMENGEISTDTIESILGGEEYKAYKNAYDERNALRDELKDLRSMKQGDMTDIQIERMNELKGMNLDDTTAIDDLRKKLDDKMKPLIQNRLSESYNEVSRVHEKFDADLNKYKGKQRDSVERAIQSGVLNNTNRTHALVDFLSAIESRTGIQFDYTNNKKLAESGFAVAGRTVNAFEKNGTVTLNVNSAKSWQTAVGHDITHVLEGANNYDALKTAIYEYAESKGELESKRAEIEELYNGIEADIDKELTAELVGDYLFSDSKFIDKLAGNRTLFQKIYDEIKYLYKAATGKELTAIEKVKKEFDRTWKDLEKKGAAEIVENREFDRAWKEVSASERFNTDNPDIRNSLSENTVENGEDFGTAQADITATYQSEVDKILNMQNTTANNLIVGYTPELMRKMGMPSLPVVIGSGHVYSAVKTEAEAKQDGNYRKGVHYHGLGDAVVKNIYEKLQDPIMIIASKDVSPNAKPLRSSHSVVAIVDVGQTNNSLIIPVEITAERTVNGEQLDVNVISSVYDRNVENLIKEAVALENSGGIGIYYAKKEANALIPAGVRFPIRIQKAIASNSIVHNFDQKVNSKISDVTQSLQFKRWFGDWQNHPESASKVVNTDGTPKVLYHQTDAEFTVFNTDNQRAGRLDTDTPAGMFFKPTDQDIGISGTKQMAVYLNARNMLELKNREEAHTYWMEHIPQYAELQSQYDAVDEAYSKRYDEAEAAGDEWYEQHYDDLVSGKISDAEAMQVMDAPLDKILNEWKAKTEPISVRQKELVTEYMKQSTYDGMHLLYDGSRNGVDVETYIVFSPTQIKSATDNIGTFDGKNPDIRYSLSENGEQPSTVGTPLQYLYYDQDIAPIRSDIKPKTDTPNKDIAPVRKDIAPVRDDISPARDDIAPVAENAATTDSNFEAPVREDTTPAKDTPTTNSVQETKQKISEEIKAIETEIANNEKFHEEVVKNYDEQIAKLREEHSALKNKKTKKAKDILSKISSIEALKATIDSDYEKRINSLKTRAGKMKSPGYGRAIQKRVKMQEHAQFAADLLGDTSTWVDKKTGLQYETNTERRNLRDIVRDENGKKDIAKADKIDDALNGQYNREEAARQRELAKVRGKYAKMDITSAEDAYIQMLGELRHNPDTTLKEEDVQNYYNKHKNKIDTKKVDKIIEMAREDYDSFLQRVNEKLSEQGMKEIPYRQGYFPHFTDTKQNFIQKLLNWKTQKTEIPTSIAGLTEEFNPNKKWQSFDKHRRTDKTDYSFMKGFDTYSDGVLDWIYHLDTIQKRRAVENYIRFIHSDEGVKQRIREIENDETIDGDEAQARIDAIKVEAQNPLNNFIQDFRTKTNILTGKKNSLDRSLEQKTSRAIYSVMTNVQNRLSGNLVAGNIRSALTNFIPITQSWAQVSPLRSLEAAKDTIKNAIQDDGLINKSTFLTNRLRQADKLYKTNWDKISDKAGILFDVIDGISSQIIWRSKYNQNLANKMTEAQAIANADQFAENVMAGRSKGNEPTLFNAKSPLVKIFTAFQLEVNNQYGYFFKDVPNDVKAESKKWKGALVKGYTTAFVGAYVYNAIMEQITGSGAALDPIGIIAELLKDLFGDDDDKDYWEILENTGENIAKELPLVGGILGGGRIPIANVFPYSNKGGVIESAKALYNDIEEGNGRNIGNELMNPVFSLVTPLGGGQIKKTIQGLNMFNTDEKHPIAGSYTGSGNLRFPVEDTPLNRVQAGLFGQYANTNAREYFDNGYAPLNDKQIQEFKDVDIPIKDYWEYREGLKEINSREGSTVGDKFDYVAGLDLPVSKKNILINNIVDRKDKVDLTDYDKFADYAEFDLFVKNRKMYDFLQENNIPFKNYITGEKGTKEAYSWAANNPEGYSLSKAVTDDITAYKAYTKVLNNIEPDKNAKGEVIKDSRSKKVAAFVNSLNLSNEAKYILYKIEFKSYNAHNRDIVNYIESRDDLSYNDKVNIYKKLGFTIENGRVYWD